jgi:hypothetical protein
MDEPLNFDAGKPHPYAPWIDSAWFKEWEDLSAIKKPPEGIWEQGNGS